LSTTDKIEEQFQEFAKNEVMNLRFHLERMTESPIELLLAATLCAYSSWSLWDIHAQQSIDVKAVTSSAGIADCSGVLFGHSGVIATQAVVAPGGASYRVDFALLVFDEKFAIELDGHDFHERTKEQARRDKSRDRALTMAGWKVLRFTGSEVYANPLSVVDQLEAAQDAAVDRAYEKHLAEESRKLASSSDGANATRKNAQALLDLLNQLDEQQ